jgi:Cu2+-exporting ATPase
VVDSVQSQVQVDNAIGDLTPEQKLARLKAHQQRGEVVAMIGDGVNDAPILSYADLSIALSSGSELSRSQADIILLNGKFDQLPRLFDVARATRRITQQNIRWALTYNIVVMPLAAAGFLTPWIAAIGMSCSSLIVVLNALRIKNSVNG